MFCVALITIGGSFIAAHTILSEFAITDPFQQILLVLLLVGGTIPAGMLGQKTFSKVKQKITQSTKEIKSKNTSETPAQRKLTPPDLFLKDSWYQTNFTKTDKGNSLQYGQIYLWIKIKDVRSYVTAMIKDANGIALQVDQSHSFDEDNNIETTRLELLKADGTSFPKGIYHLQVNGDRGTGDSIGIKNDTFEIV